MAGRNKDKAAIPEMVRKSLLVDSAKLDRARKLMGASSDAEVLRVALDHLLTHFPPIGEEEE
jgi:hypothetical protein